MKMMTEDLKKLETLSYKPTVKKEDCDWPACTCDDFECPEMPANAPPPTMGFNSVVIKPEISVNKTEDAGQPLEYPEMCENTKRIVNACKQVVQTDIVGSDANGVNSEQPNQNIMIIEQAEGATKVVLELLDQIEAYNTDQRGDVQGCIWTLEGWLKNNLKHLKKAFE